MRFHRFTLTIAIPGADASHAVAAADTSKGCLSSADCIVADVRADFDVAPHGMLGVAPTWPVKIDVAVESDDAAVARSIITLLSLRLPADHLLLELGEPRPAKHPLALSADVLEILGRSVLIVDGLLSQSGDHLRAAGDPRAAPACGPVLPPPLAPAYSVALIERIRDRLPQVERALSAYPEQACELTCAADEILALAVIDEMLVQASVSTAVPPQLYLEVEHAWATLRADVFDTLDVKLLWDDEMHDGATAETLAEQWLVPASADVPAGP